MAFFLALVIAHRFLRQYALRRNRSWCLVSTACLGLFLPVVFAVAFIVPGIVLQMNKTAIRILVTRGGETREIPANVADTWIDKVFKEMKPAGLK